MWATPPHVHTPMYTFPHVHTPMYTPPHVHTHMYTPPHPIFPSGCEGKLGVALESLQGRRDLT